ncbi:MAG TPA: LysR family transcriptional regulator [Longimicrobium sp.]|nr:LysR family transcriptional regulator [Longimicrobium sp.]
MTDDLDGISMFLAVVEAKGFRAAGQRLGVSGAALSQAVRRLEEIVGPYVERGELVPVLEEFSTPFPGFYLDYPERRQASPPLRALIDYLLHLRQGPPPTR